MAAMIQVEALPRRLLQKPQDLHHRLVGDPPGQRLLGWLGPLAAAVVGGVLRFWDLANPHQLVFDETYYVKQGWSMILFGVEMRNSQQFGDKVDQAFTQGTPNVFDPTTGDLVVHPPVGKWLIGLGEWLFGIDSSFGWRFAVALLGTISIVMVGRAARRLLGSSLLGTIAALLLAVDGHHLVHSRTGLLDIIVMFFALGAFCALLIDRDRTRAILATRMVAAEAADPPPPARSLGPWLGLRPWRWVAAVLLGLCAGTKWSGFYVIAVFGLLTVFWDVGARRAAGIRSWLYAGVVKDGLFAFVTIVPTALLVYVLSWWGWFRSEYGYNRQWALTHPADARWAWVPDSMRSWWNYQAQILDFHRNLSTPHPYQSNPWSWLIQGRPTLFFAEYPKNGELGCTVDLCARIVTSVGTPTIWWAATISVAILVFKWAFARDWRAGAILAGYAGGYLPWFLLGDRTIYAFYAVSFVPWAVLGVTYVIGMVLGPADASRERRQAGALAVGSYLVVTVLLFAYFYPIWTAQVVPHSFWFLHMWFPSWV